MKQNYLNYLKWTEAIALMLGLIDSEEQAVQLVNLALDIDLMLGARLAGETQIVFQPYAVESTMQKLASTASEEIAWLKLEVLERIGSKAAIDHLICLLNDPDSRINSNAFLALLNISPEAVPEQCLFKENSRKIQQILERVPEQLETREELLLHPQILEHIVPDVRFIFDAWASKKLNSYQAIERLTPMLECQDKNVQWSVVEVLGSLKSEMSIPSLLWAVTDSKSLVHHSAAVVIGKLGFTSVIPELIQIIEQNSTSDIRCNAVLALRLIGSEEIIPGLVQAMQDSDFWVCCNAIEASEKIDSEACIPGLLAVTLRPESHLCRLAAYRLRMLSSKESVAKAFNEKYLQILVEKLEHPDIWVRWYIALTLWNVVNKGIVPSLVSKLNHQNLDIGLSAALVLGKFGYEDAIPGLVHIINFSNLTEHPDTSELSYLAAYALGQVKNSAASQYLQELATLISTPSGENAFRAISKIQEQSKFYNYEIAQSAVKGGSEMAGVGSGKGALTYNIGSVGILNTGSVEIRGDQVAVKYESPKQDGNAPDQS